MKCFFVLQLKHLIRFDPRVGLQQEGFQSQAPQWDHSLKDALSKTTLFSYVLPCVNNKGFVHFVHWLDYSWFMNNQLCMYGNSHHFLSAEFLAALKSFTEQLSLYTNNIIPTTLMCTTCINNSIRRQLTTAVFWAGANFGAMGICGSPVLPISMFLVIN